MTRLMTIHDAAKYCSLSTSGFRDWVAKNRLPGPIPGTQRWDKEAIDRALDRASGINRANSAGTAYDEWMLDKTG